VQHDYRALLGFQSGETALELFPIRNRTRVVADGGLELENAHVLRPAAPLATLVRAGVDHQPMEPGIEFIGIAERRKLLPSAHESFLHCILREVRFPNDEASDRVQAVPGRGREDFERFVISACCCLDEISPHTLSITNALQCTRW
jgi:hypothetical protein